ncbi:MAG: SOS response-associated peptidase [Candidatus Binatus sp.]|uniref:SOS response-associated peptidase n=1 Tax=Candidatus Binatus sp. TaxID=2811406 RepID=UPI002722379E|nr:SOS response-associated peptidase [Candidatus Binatus sp.]MDO8433879.1 SOS response-associated peptidase [Candidatus Binatus sp.]
MCGRFTITRRDGNSLAAELGVATDSFADYKPHYNVAPTQDHFIVRIKFENREAIPARWGFVNSWAKDASGAARCINARSETVERVRAFREAFIKRRCVVPADGFFEWTGPKNERQPIWFHREDGGLILMAGLYESWQMSPGNWQRTFTILTTAANSIAARYHDRMPVILDDRHADDWMDPRAPKPLALKKLLAPAPDELLVPTPVSPRVNDVANDSPDLLETPKDHSLAARQLNLL